MAINKFADLRNEEFKKVFGYNHKSKSLYGNQRQKLIYDYKDDIPDSWDWRDEGAVTPVKDQSMCGAALAYSIVRVIIYFLRLLLF